MKYCKNCGSRIGLDCGDAEPDNEHYCSFGCGIRAICTPKNCGASPLACEIAVQLFELDGFVRIRSQEFAASCARRIDMAIEDWKRESRQQLTKQELDR